MGFYLIGPLATLIPLGSISSQAFKPYCDDGLLGISPTDIWPYGPCAVQLLHFLSLLPITHKYTIHIN
jgi:hypothetical protein